MTGMQFHYINDVNCSIFFIENEFHSVCNSSTDTEQKIFYSIMVYWEKGLGQLYEKCIFTTVWQQ